MKTLSNITHVIALTDEELAIINTLLVSVIGPGRLNRLASDMYYNMPTSPLDKDYHLKESSISFLTPGKD